MTRTERQRAKFWKYETPEEMRTATNTFRFYPHARRLVVHLPNFFSEKEDAWKWGKGISVNLASLAAKPEVVTRLIEILQSLQADCSAVEDGSEIEADAEFDAGTETE